MSTWHKALLFILLAVGAFCTVLPQPVQAATHQPTWWSFQCIDTMKYSRDRAREFLGNTTLATETITWQTEAVAKTGATHIAIATPYDEEFIPILTEWVKEARKHNLGIWFRGNWSGWENWFGYNKISRAEHLEKTEAFILAHPELFEDGDYFTACPECENGGPGDPRRTGDTVGHRQFLIDGHKTASAAFAKIGKDVNTTLNPMNGDVAKLTMDKETTAALGGVVTIDHYVKDPKKLAADVISLANQSGGTVVLGEFGAPIPDINGSMTESQQDTWLSETIKELSSLPSLVGVSYWTGVGGSTQIWNTDGTSRKAVATLTKVFTPPAITGEVVDQFGAKVEQATVMTTEKSVLTDTSGAFVLPYLYPTGNVIISAPEHTDTVISWETVLANPEQPIVISRTKVSFFARLLNYLKQLAN